MRTLLKAAFLGCTLVLGGAGLASTENAAGALTGREAVDRLLENSDAFSVAVAEGAFETIAAAIERDAQAVPDDPRLALGMAIVEQSRGNYKAAREQAERAAKLDPASAVAQFWLGNVVFSGIGEAGMLDKMSLAGKGRKAYEKAIELDPNHVGARYAMAQFYSGAPGIAGGSDKKAREQAEALLKIDGGAFFGHILIGQLAAKDKKWADMTAAYSAAEQLADRDERRTWVLRSWAWSLIDAKKDPAAALAIIDRYASAAPAADATAPFFRARTLQDLGRHAEAAEQYRAALAIRPEALNSGYGLAECLEKSGDKPGAIAAYEDFIQRHPDDKRVSDARKAVKRLKK